MDTAFAINDLQRLMPFVQVVKSGSFASAAAQLRVTPPAISKSIARLEQELGVRLFNRTTRHVELTPAGRTFADHVYRAFAEIEQAVTLVREAAHEPKGLVRVWVTSTFGRYGLMPVIARFHERHPQVQLEITFEDSEPELVGHGYDVCIGLGRAQGKSHLTRMLCPYPIVLVASPAYIERRGTPEAPADLDRHDCIGIVTPVAAGWTLLRVGRARSASARLPQRYVHTPRGTLVVRGQRDASLMAALYGAGIVPTAALVAQTYIRTGRLVHVLPDYRMLNRLTRSDSIHLQLPNRSHLPAKVRVFIDFLYEQFGADQAQTPNRRPTS